VEDRLVKDEDGRAKLYADIAHPINSACREMIQERVIHEFHLEQDRSKLPGYKSSYDDYDHEDAPPPSGFRAAASTREKTHVQPAEPQPPKPHKLPLHNAPQGATPRAPSQTQATHHDGFGAGIF
jgi:stage V sporulation protein G